MNREVGRLGSGVRGVLGLAATREFDERCARDVWASEGRGEVRISDASVRKEDTRGVA